jgi:hypothetical protein
MVSMTKKQKPIRLNAAIAKRVKAAGYDQPRRGTCIICKGDWMSCPHNREQIHQVVEATKMAETLGIKLP